jgi:hypothetical protein
LCTKGVPNPVARERFEEDDIAEDVRGLKPGTDGQPSWATSATTPLCARWGRVICLCLV